jgi:hypothetical protein
MIHNHNRNLNPNPKLIHTEEITIRIKSRIMKTALRSLSLIQCQWGEGFVQLKYETMKPTHNIYAALLCAITFSASVCGQTQLPANTSANAEAKAAEAKAKSDVEQEKKAAEWVASLGLGDQAKETRLREVVVTHLKAIRDWHNEHPFTTVPAGINPVTGKPLSNLDRQVIANSAIPKTVHTNLMAGLRKDLSEEQVEAILDKYTIGKVAFTMAGYRAIVPNLTKEEEAAILAFLKQAREEAVDYKNMNQISVIFEIYKTKSEQFLNANGRNWKEMYKAYTDAAKAKKAATPQPDVKPNQ